MAIADFVSMTYFDNTILKYLIFLGIASLGVIVGKIAYHIVQKIVKKLTAKTKTNLDDIIVDMIEEPGVVMIVLFGIQVGWQFLEFPNYPKVPVYFGHLYYTAMVLNIAWLVSRLLDALIENYLKPLTAKSSTDLDDHLVPILSKIINIIVFAMALIMILHHFGQEIGPLLAGLGIGGLAFALAAKDLLSNLFGSVTILMDKPFSIGQRVKINGHDGFVREINLRTTKIETLEGRYIYVPNSKFTENIVENVTQEWARKVKFDIGLVYGTGAEKMRKAKEIVADILKTEEGINNDKTMIYFTEFAAYSKNIMVVYWITDKDRIFPVQDNVNFRIMEEFEKAGIEMAFPTQTIELKR